MNAKQIRGLYPITKERAYLFSGGLAPVSVRHEQAMKKHMDWLSEDPDDMYVNGLDADASDCRRMFAQLTGCDEDEVAIVESTSAGCNIAFDLIDPVARGNVVFDDFSYPSSVFPWHLPPHEALTKRFVHAREDGIIHLEDFEQSIDENTVAVCISHVTPIEGFKQDIKKVAEIAHAKGALVIVDGAQSAGAMEIDLHDTGVDFFSTTAMKWLLGAAGVAFLYVRKEFQKQIDPLVISWGYESENPSHSQFLDYLQWQGTYDMSAYLTIPDTIDFLNNNNWDIMAKECRKLNLWAKDKILSEIDTESLSVDSFLGQMSSFYLDLKGPVTDQYKIDFYNKYQTQILFVNWNNRSLFRISIQVYNNKQDIYKLIEALKDYQEKVRL